MLLTTEPSVQPCVVVMRKHGTEYDTLKLPVSGLYSSVSLWAPKPPSLICNFLLGNTVSGPAGSQLRIQKIGTPKKRAIRRIVVLRRGTPDSG